MSQDKHLYTRRLDTLADRLSKVGGLFGAITPFCYAVVAIATYKAQYMYLMKELFVKPSRQDKSKQGAKLSKEELSFDARIRMRNRT